MRARNAMREASCRAARTFALWGALVISLAAPAEAVTIAREPMPDPAQRQALGGVPDQSADAVAASVQRETGGADITPPQKAVPSLARGKPGQQHAPARDLDVLGRGWEQLNAGDFSAALASFAEAAASTDKLISQEASLGMGYAYWRLGREAQAEAQFKALAEQNFRIPEVIPNLLFLLYKRGGPKAAEPYLKYLPENQRAVWRK